VGKHGAACAGDRAGRSYTYKAALIAEQVKGRSLCVNSFAPR
jgi:hypothetical protein